MQCSPDPDARFQSNRRRQEAVASDISVRVDMRVQCAQQVMEKVYVDLGIDNRWFYAGKGPASVKVTCGERSKHFLETSLATLDKGPGNGWPMKTRISVSRGWRRLISTQTRRAADRTSRLFRRGTTYIKQPQDHSVLAIKFYSGILAPITNGC